MSRELYVIEDDRSTPIPVPPDRPLTYAEQIELWKDAIPPALRVEEGPGVKMDEKRHDAEKELERVTMDRYGWLLNRLEWDRDWPAGVPYELPDCCKPGADRVSRRSLRRLRASFLEPR